MKSAKEWPAQRVYLKSMLAHYLYGSMPPRPEHFDLKRVTSKPVFNHDAVQERYAITLKRNGKQATFHFELIRPDEHARVPIIVKNCPELFDNRENTSVSHDKAAAREAVKRGYLLCLFNRKEVAADHADNRNMGVFPLYPEYDWGHHCRLGVGAFRRDRCTRSSRACRHGADRRDRPFAGREDGPVRRHLR